MSGHTGEDVVLDLVVQATKVIVDELAVVDVVAGSRLLKNPLMLVVDVTMLLRRNRAGAIDPGALRKRQSPCLAVSFFEQAVHRPVPVTQGNLNAQHTGIEVASNEEPDCRRRIVKNRNVIKQIICPT